MTLSNTLTPWRKSLPSILRRLAITLSVALVGALAVGSSWLMHRPVGYSGDRARILPDLPGLRLRLPSCVGDDGRGAGD